MTEQPLKPYVVRLSLPIETFSMPAAIEIFVSLAATESWAFQIETPEGRYVVDTVMENGAVKEFAILRHEPAEPPEPVELMGT